VPSYSEQLRAGTDCVAPQGPPCGYAGGESNLMTCCGVVCVHGSGSGKSNRECEWDNLCLSGPDSV
jgi:hypothetical protein